MTGTGAARPGHRGVGAKGGGMLGAIASRPSLLEGGLVAEHGGAEARACGCGRSPALTRSMPEHSRRHARGGGGEDPSM